MKTYYDILGLPSTASQAEIKEAFRTLAKKFHPDRNPLGREQFTVILQAYEVLMDPSLRASYDLKLKYNSTASTQNKRSSAGNKEWKFDDRELRRRKYYDEHIRKYEKVPPRTNPTSSRVAYNDFRYLLFATPIAVGLFLLIMHWTGANIPTQPTVLNRNNIAQLSLEDYMRPDFSPFKAYFGSEVFVRPGVLLQIRNQSGSDALVCIFDSSRFLRSFYVADDFSARISQLPRSSFYVRVLLGKEYDASKLIHDTSLKGDFKIHDGCFLSQMYQVNDSITIDLNETTLPYFNKITFEEYFSKSL